MSKDLNIFFILLTEDIILEAMECYSSAGIEGV
jgi:hypothetical protein